MRLATKSKVEIVSTPGSPETNRRYTYAQLPSTGIRLIEVQPRKADLPLSCEIYHATRKQEYKALSYVCGDRSCAVPILLNGRNLQVGWNLHRFLLLASELFPGEPLWIDELCIDQTNFSERNHQVQQIGETFRCARCVIAWLGSAAYPANLLFPEAMTKTPVLSATEMLKKDDSFNRDYPTLQEDLVLRAITHFLDLSYFTRLWVYQEFLVAKDVLFVRGNHQIPASMLISYLARFMLFRPDAYSERPMLSCPELYGLRVSRGFLTFERFSQRLPVVDLDELLSPVFDGECAEWRDRVFGLLSLCSQKPWISVDYRDDPEDLMIKLLVAFQLCNKKKAMEVLLNLYRIYVTYNVKFSLRGCSLGRNLIHRYDHVLDTVSHEFSFTESPRCQQRFRLKVDHPGSPTAITCGYCLREFTSVLKDPIYVLCAKAGKVHAFFWNGGGDEAESTVHVVGKTDVVTQFAAVRYQQTTKPLGVISELVRRIRANL